MGVHHVVGSDHFVTRQTNNGVCTGIKPGGQALGTADKPYRLHARWHCGCRDSSRFLFLHRIRVGMRDQGARCVDGGGVRLNPFSTRLPAARHHEGGTAQVSNVVDALLFRQPMRDVDDRTLGVAEYQQIGLAVGQHRAAHLVRPIVVVRNAAQRRFDAADDDVGIGERFACALRVNNHGAIRALVRCAIRRIGIIRARFVVRGVAIDHRIHIAGGDAEKQVWLAQFAKIFCRLPIRLADDADAKALCFEQATNQRHAETGVVNIGIAGDDDDVAGVPAKGFHFRARRGQKRRDAIAFRPVGAIAVDDFWCGCFCSIHRGEVYSRIPLFPGLFAC